MQRIVASKNNYLSFRRRVFNDCELLHRESTYDVALMKYPSMS